MATVRILVVEDDATIGGGLRDTLAAQGYQTRWVATGAEALDAARADPPDLVLLDLQLPDVDGVEVCRRLRAGAATPAVVMLTARREEIDVVVGLDAGADDYVTKPFRLAELLARLRAHVRRLQVAGEAGCADRLVVGDLELDRAARRVWLAGSELELRPKEFDLLALLMAEAGRAVTRERIMAEVWDEHWFGSTKTLDMHIAALRRRLGERGDDDSRITTLRGIGYRLEP
ncbi:MAG TPA: response regulator transcription factor [Actinomycetes bacterium]|nr:response regulator transcription factor [Actinomycetes bacterium]